MALPVTVYRWDDAGAPQISTDGGTPSEIINVLKKCLVEGYGDKAGLGWSIPFEDVASNKIAFRNSTVVGSGGFTQFWSEGGLDTPNNSILYRSSRAMTALDVFHEVRKYNGFNSSVGMYQWVIIGTGRAFYFILNLSTRNDVMATGTHYSYSGFFGDITPAINSDASTYINYTYSTEDDRGGGWSSNFDYISNNGLFCYMANTDGSGLLQKQQIKLAFTHSATLVSYGVPPTTLTIANISIGPNLSFKDEDGLTVSMSVKQPLIRGIIPGLFQMAEHGYSDQPWPQIINRNGVDYWLLRQAHVGAASMMIRMDEW